jgi:hypothetical protein
MDSKKKEALRKAGFRVGTIQQLLGLSNEEMQVIEKRILEEAQAAEDLTIEDKGLDPEED